MSARFGTRPPYSKCFKCTDIFYTSTWWKESNILGKPRLRSIGSLAHAWELKLIILNHTTKWYCWLWKFVESNCRKLMMQTLQSIYWIINKLAYRIDLSLRGGRDWKWRQPSHFSLCSVNLNYHTCIKRALLLELSNTEFRIISIASYHF